MGLQMSFFGWIILGLVAGFINSKIVNNQGSGIILDIVLGVMGAVVGVGCFRSSGQMELRGSIVTVCLWLS
jgi:uncharacterized membrane protein YeaQ/YmgE (transglycosylase-associated protein family)